MASRDFYIPCNKPATKVVHSKVDRRDYRMCDACADHNIRHRGMQLVGVYRRAPDSGE